MAIGSATHRTVFLVLQMQHNTFCNDASHELGLGGYHNAGMTVLEPASNCHRCHLLSCGLWNGVGPLVLGHFM